MTIRKQTIKQFTYSFLAIFLVLIGFGLVYASTNDYIQSNMIQTKYAEQTVGEVKAEKIYLPSMDRILDVTDGFVTDNRWTVSDSGVSHLTTSVTPGSTGNAVLYGHNREGVLGKLWKVQEDDLVYVVLSDGSISKYKIFERKEVKPNEVEILNNVGDSRLTLYTCSGFLDSARYVIVGELVS